MAGGFWWLLFLSLIIASTSIGAGMLPLALSLSRKRIQAISNFGMGLLIGTALIVIVPEGVSTLYGAYAVEPESHHHGADKNPIRSLLSGRDEDSHGHKEEDHHEASPERYVGIALVIGFVFMYLVNLFSVWSSQSNNRGYSTFSMGNLRSFSSPESVETPMTSSRSFSTTLGLLIHATADGIALGATANSAKPSLGLIVFFAIMLHKAPAAFGLVAILLKQGLSKRQARVHLIAFSLAAPVGAFGTWLAISILGGRGDDTEAHHKTTEWWSGILLLFSAGTFLFVAMHAMQEIAGGGDHSHGIEMHSHELRMQELDSAPKDDEDKLQNSLLTVIGMLAPLITYLSPHAH